MKWNYGFTVFDLETTDDEDDRRIIEIGMVRLDKELKQIAKGWNRLIFPDKQISEYVTGITGITNEEVLSKGSWLAGGLDDFECIHMWGDSKALKKTRLACWGNYFDINVLRNEYKRIGRQYPWSGTVIDVKSLALTWLALSGRRTDSASLEKVAGYMGIELEPGDRYHGALPDAKVTAKIFQRVMKDFSDSVWLPDTSGKPYKQVRVGQ